jgi:NTE family protein
MKPQISERGLDGVTIFRDLAPAERARLASELTTLTLRRGDVLVRQGEPAEALYVVVTGRFVVTIAGRRDAISEIGPGQPIGEIAFLAGGARTATVTALRDGLVLRLGRAEFEDLAVKSPSIWHTLTETLARRVAQANVSRAPPPDPRPRTLALVRAGDGALSPVFVEAFAEVFGAPTGRSCSGRRWPRRCWAVCASTAPRRRAL